MSLQTPSLKRTPTVPLDRGDLQRVVAVINGKGGVGKTTLTANIGGLLALSGWKVLLVDLDPQGNLGLDLGYEGTEQDDRGAELSASMVAGGHIAVPVLAVRPNLDVLVGGQLLEGASAQLLTQALRNTTAARLALANTLARIASEYDIILIDCPPGNEILQSSAIAAARSVLVPVKADRASIRGLEITAERLQAVDDLNPEIDLLGVVLVDSGTGESRVRADFIDQVVDTLGGEDARPYLFETFLRHASATASRARQEGLLVHELEQKVRSGPGWYERMKNDLPEVGPKSTSAVADDLQAIAAELVRRLTSHLSSPEEPS